MTLPDQFASFIEIISLNQTRRTRIERALSTFQNFCNEDGPVSEALVEQFRHGSFAHGTVVRPSNGEDEYDVDVTLVLDNSKLSLQSKSPSSILSWVSTRIRSYYRKMPFLESAPKIVQMPRCIRIEYAGDFHLDIVPAHYRTKLFGGFDYSSLLVPDRLQKNWINSNPKGLNAWVRSVDKSTDRRFSKVVKMLKQWRNQKFDGGRAPKSIVLEVLTGQNISGLDSSTLEEVFHGTLCSISDWFNNHLFISSISISNPSLTTEDLALAWPTDCRKLFLKKLDSAISWSEKALNAKHESSTLNCWGNVFGNGFFPL